MMKNKYSPFPRQYLMIINLTHWANIPNIVPSKHPEVPERNKVQKNLIFVTIKTYFFKVRINPPLPPSKSYLASYHPRPGSCLTPSSNELIRTHFSKQETAPFIYQSELQFILQQYSHSTLYSSSDLNHEPLSVVPFLCTNKMSRIRLHNSIPIFMFLCLLKVSNPLPSCPLFHTRRLSSISHSHTKFLH